jgi:hypothetical protein
MWWSTKVDSDQALVKVENGVATLPGTVDSQRKQDAATMNTYDGGAVLVRNKLKVAWVSTDRHLGDRCLVAASAPAASRNPAVVAHPMPPFETRAVATLRSLLTSITP